MLDLNLFENHGIKPSITRIKIYEYLLNHGHPTVDEIYQELKPELPTLSKTTVYNVLSLFHEKALVSTLVLNHKEQRYEINHQPHTHFECIRCGNVYDMPYVQIDYRSIAQDGFEYVNHDFVVKGVCATCKQE